MGINNDLCLTILTIYHYHYSFAKGNFNGPEEKMCVNVIILSLLLIFRGIHYCKQSYYAEKKCLKNGITKPQMQITNNKACKSQNTLKNNLMGPRWYSGNTLALHL